MPMSSPQQAVQIDSQGRTRNSDTVTKDRSLNNGDFQATLSAVNGPATFFVAREVDGAGDPQYQAAAVTNATINGVAGASNGYGYGAPYLGVGTPGVGGSSVGGAGGYVATNQQAGFGIGDPGGNVGAPGGAPGGLPSEGGLSTDYYEKRALLTQMNDANWQMLLLQNDVQNINREFTILTNIMSVRHQTEVNIARNTGRAAG